MAAGESQHLDYIGGHQRDHTPASTLVMSSTRMPFKGSLSSALLPATEASDLRVMMVVERTKPHDDTVDFRSKQLPARDTDILLPDRWM